MSNDMTISDQFRAWAKEAVEEWDGQDNADLLRLLEEKLDTKLRTPGPATKRMLEYARNYVKAFGSFPSDHTIIESVEERRAFLAEWED